jgi:phosphatidylinositol alpha-1,6-mannosyltransferase
LSGPPRHDILHRRLFRLHTDAVICVSDVAARATEAALRLAPGSVAVARGGVDLERFRPGLDGREMRRIVHVPDDAPLAVLVARVRAGRGPRWLLRVAPRVLERVPNARIVVFGRGELKKWFREEIRKPQYDGRVLNGGWRGGDGLPLLYACADVTLFLGLGSEGSCRAILEAMACGKPTIGTDAGAVPEIVAHGETGIVVPHQNDAALADALVALLSDPARARSLGAAARKRAEERYTEAARAEAVMAVYQRVMARA